MLRNKAYAIFRGIECEIGYTTKRGYYLLLRKEHIGLHSDRELEEIGFVADEDGDYFKEPITQSEVTEVYRIRTYAIYQGRKFGVWQEKNNGQEYLINYMDNNIEDKEYLNSEGFHMLDSRGMEYEKWVSKEEIEKLFEEKQHARYFEAKEPIGGSGAIESIVLYDRTVE